VGSGWTGIGESLGGGTRGQMVSAEYSQIDPFHNQLRRWASPNSAAEALYRVHCGGPEIERMVVAARDHVRNTNWIDTVTIFEEALKDAVSRRAPTPTAPIAANEEAAAAE